MRMAFSASRKPIRPIRNYFYHLIPQLLGIRILQLNDLLSKVIVIVYKLIVFCSIVQISFGTCWNIDKVNNYSIVLADTAVQPRDPNRTNW